MCFPNYINVCAILIPLKEKVFQSCFSQNRYVFVLVNIEIEKKSDWGNSNRVAL